jgi:biopolymer transport protein ExbD
VRIRKGEPENVHCRDIVLHFRDRDVPAGTGVIVSAEKGVPYGPVGQVMVVLQDAGYLVGFTPEDSH